MSATQAIQFYNSHREYGFMSNFALFPIRLKEKIWPTSEHYFQAQKFAGSEYEEEIRLAYTPGLAAKMGRDRTKKLREDWEQVKDSVMMDAVSAKFAQHPVIRMMLIHTGNAELVEHTEKDAYWGDGGDGSGKNKLGHILMQVRACQRTLLEGTRCSSC